MAEKQGNALNLRRHPASFRDPQGFVYLYDGEIYRQVHQSCREHYDHLMQSGLYEALVKETLLIPHQEVDLPIAKQDDVYKILKPERIPFISYPYEWSFSQLKEAALTTLRIQRIALDHGMSLRDCSAYNVTFYHGNPVFIDSLSFEKYQEGRPWDAYRQFCQHFLAPLALMAYKDVRLNQLLKIYIDGIPLDLASRLLPFSTLFFFSLLSHIHLQAKSQKYFADKTVRSSKAKISLLAFKALIENLESSTKKIKWRCTDTIWSDYYLETNYSAGAFEHKKKLVGKFLDEVQPASLWDLGGNVGVFSRLASQRRILTVSLDSDPLVVEKNYREGRNNRDDCLIPLCVDLVNPSPGLGWENNERMSLSERGPADVVLALALIHHLAIANNLPFDKIAHFLKRLCRFLIIEFVPKEDSQVQRLLANREDIFKDYTEEAFEKSFHASFSILKKISLENSKRILYWMQARTIATL